MSLHQFVALLHPGINLKVDYRLEMPINPADQLAQCRCLYSLELMTYCGVAGVVAIAHRRGALEPRSVCP
jgi:hypothetical protein